MCIWGPNARHVTPFASTHAQEPDTLTPPTLTCIVRFPQSPRRVYPKTAIEEDLDCAVRVSENEVEGQSSAQCQSCMAWLPNNKALWEHTRLHKDPNKDCANHREVRVPSHHHLFLTSNQRALPTKETETIVRNHQQVSRT